MNKLPDIRDIEKMTFESCSLPRHILDGISDCITFAAKKGIAKAVYHLEKKDMAFSDVIMTALRKGEYYRRCAVENGELYVYIEW